jgi:hypothetical protein
MQESAPSPREGLCATCARAQRVTNDRGSVFVRCTYAAIDASYAKYPRLPVLACPAHTPGAGGVPPIR